ncbi:hypothetical protein EGH24_13780 [Halonotius terrestris]|uniref:Uncharacterized protein n=1 Tax=Halonotius terrestris TaxID=2487750 RepID=A0A8J8P7P0_9EURY|nr:hypothetical protein [Halonotius terrestris]TQQ78587.1 hypothetical protein EGH24_13780 [Halonotius terrestris]
MSADEEPHGGLPTRAIHESYLDLQRSLQQYRDATDAAADGATQQAHGQLQSGVLTFYELLRPHLKHEGGVRAWWDGEPPSYPGDGSPPDPDDGRGVLAVQQRAAPVALDRVDKSPDELNSLAQWDDALPAPKPGSDGERLDGVGADERVVGIVGAGDSVVVSVHSYQTGLRQLDGWETEVRTVREQRDGFMSDKTRERTVRQRVPVEKLKRAARELVEASDKMNLLTKIDSEREFTDLRDELNGDYRNTDQVQLPHENAE